MAAALACVQHRRQRRALKIHDWKIWRRRQAVEAVFGSAKAWRAKVASAGQIVRLARYTAWDGGVRDGGAHGVLPHRIGSLDLCLPSLAH